MKLVLLHDTDEPDFARDVLDFMRAMGLDVTTVMFAPNEGRSLSDKEQATLNAADAYVFLLTPGSERNGVKGYASQSICYEMGMAQKRFEKDRSKVIYLTDSNWKPHAIDQTAYIRFDRTKYRSMVQALRDLVNELRAAGAFAPPTGLAAKTLTIADVADRVPAGVKAVCAWVAEQKDMMASRERLDWFIRTKVTADPTDSNFLKKDLIRHKWVDTTSGAYFQLTDLGVQLVKYERAKPPPSPSAADLVKMLATYGPLVLPPAKT